MSRAGQLPALLCMAVGWCGLGRLDGPASAHAMSCHVAFLFAQSAVLRVDCVTLPNPCAPCCPVFACPCRSAFALLLSCPFAAPCYHKWTFTPISAI